MSSTSSIQDLEYALAQTGCPLCRLISDTTQSYLESLLWESVNDPPLRRRIRESNGFCREHSWALARRGASLGVAIITQDVLQSLLKGLVDLGKAETFPLSLRRIRDSLSPGQREAASLTTPEPGGNRRCPACIHAGQMEEVYLRRFLDHLLGPEGLLPAYETSDGLCLPHFGKALDRERSRRTRDALIAAQRAIWERLVNELGEFIRKNDYRFVGEEWGDESDAWLRGISALVGPLREVPR